jgi:hypothetical protein
MELIAMFFNKTAHILLSSNELIKPVQTAAAPETISVISRVIDAWRDLL